MRLPPAASRGGESPRNACAEPHRPGDHSARPSGCFKRSTIESPSFARAGKPLSRPLAAGGAPAGNGPHAHPGGREEYARFADGQIAPRDTIEVVAGRAVVKVLWTKPRRIYVPSEEYATIQVVTDEQISIVGKKPGRTVLDLWFPDPHSPNDPSKDRTLSYMIVVLPETGQCELQRWQERKRLEAEVEAYRAALKVLERQIKEAFPDSAVQLSMVGEQVVVRGEAKDVVEAAQILGIVAEHAPISNRRRGINQTSGTGGRGSNVNLNVSLGTGNEGGGDQRTSERTSRARRPVPIYW